MTIREGMLAIHVSRIDRQKEKIPAAGILAGVSLGQPTRPGADSSCSRFASK